MGMVIADRYEVIEKIGGGGMGVVYKVRHQKLDKIRALKLLSQNLASNHDLVARFEREARVMAQLEHENIVRVYDVSQDGDSYFLVQDFVDGPNLSRYLHDHHPLSHEQILTISRQIAAALDHAHRHGVIHRDVKPANVLVAQEHPLRVLVTDFGIAKVVGAESQTVMTDVGMVLGTLKYAAPEQLGYRPDGRTVPIDARADIYAFGSLVYELCEGRQFFAGLDEASIWARLFNDSEPLAPKFERPIAQELQAIVTRAMCRRPDDRYATMAELLADLDRCGNARVDSPPVEKLELTAIDPSPTAATESDEDLERHIRQLEIERQRRAAWAAQSAAEKTHETAAKAEAGELATALFREAMAQQQLAAMALQEKRYVRAKSLFERAADVFAQAAAEAESAGKTRRAERAREAMQGAKARAQQARAPERARNIFATAEAVEGEAADHLNRREIDQATTSFVDAQRLYEEAGALAALGSRREAAERLRPELARARGYAREKNAEQLAGTRFREATTTESLAETALTEGRFEEATRLLTDATRLYDEARTEADDQALRERAAQRRAAAERAGKQAAEDDAATLAAPAFAEATKIRQDAERSFTAGDFEVAATFFQHATELFGRARTQAAQARRQREAAAKEGELQRRKAGKARDDAATALTAAEAMDAARHAAATLAEAKAACEEAERSLQAGEYEAAAAAFSSARERFAAAAAEAEQARDAEAVETARKAALEAEERLRRHGALGEYRKRFEAALQKRKSAELDAGRGKLRAARAAFEESTTLTTTLADDYERHLGEVRQVQDRFHDLRRRLGDRALGDDTRARISRLHERAEKRLKEGQLSDAFDCFRELVTRLEAIEEARPAEPAPAPTHEAVGEAAGEIETATATAEVAAGTTVSEPEAMPRPRRLPVWAPWAVAALVALAIVVARWTSPVEPPAAPLRWSRLTPAGEEPKLRIGEALAFGAAVETPGAYAGLRFAWSIDGTGAATGATFDYRPSAAEQAGVREIKVVASAGDQRIENRWRVRVTEANRPPALASASPAETSLSLVVGDSQRFEVSAADPDEGDELTYVWERNGGVVASGPQASWTLPQAQSGDGEVRVRVKDAAGLEGDGKTWTLAVKEKPAPNRPPRIVSASPAQAEVEIEAGGSRTFSVGATDPDPDSRLTYTWLRNGEVVTSGPQASWTLDAAEAGDREVAVRVSDPDGLRSEPRTWRLAVAEPPPAVNLPPRIVGTSPPTARTVRVRETRSIDFSVSAEDPNRDDALRYAWYLDGRRVAQARTWRFSAPVAESGSTAHEVEVEVADQAGLRAPRERWDVRIEAEPPRIVDFSPAQSAVVVEPGQSAEFSVRARANATPRYEWSLDGAPARAGGNRFRLPAEVDAGTHTVSVAAIDRGQRATKLWSVEIKPAELPPPRPAGITESEVRAWLAEYESAWERKDARKLRDLGVISNVEALNRAFAGYGRLDVEISNVSIRVDGASATVSFDRRDVDDTGKVLAHPTERYQLRQVGGAVVAQN